MLVVDGLFRLRVLENGLQFGRWTFDRAASLLLVDGRFTFVDGAIRVGGAADQLRFQLETICTDDEGLDTGLAPCLCRRFSCGSVGGARLLLLEELVAQDLPGPWPILWVVLQHPLHERDGLIRCSGDDFAQVDFRVVRHLEKFSIGKTLGVRPIVMLGFAENPGDLLPLVHLRTARE